MELSFILKIAGIGMTVAVVCQILSRLGKDDQSMLVSVGGIILVLILLIEELGGLIEMVKDVFGI
jgi:stage III sporulation protein AC